jgi:UPF0755 protein
MRETLFRKRIPIFLCAITALVLIGWLLAPPADFPRGAVIAVPEGSSLQSVAEQLEDENVIRSPFWFRVISIMLGGERRMKAGEYYLHRPQNPVSLAWRILHGKHNIEIAKITIPEGFTVKEISGLFDSRFTVFDNRLFEKIAPEGYLFPDTYFIPVTATASSTAKLLRDNFVRQIFDLMPAVESSKRTLEEIVTMASLIEGEANNQADRELVSAILWKRLDMGMALQVDVERSTYEFPGLPEKPINNPGLPSIEAALHPTTTPYLYYLTGTDGKMRYAKTFDEHKLNIEKYLRN